MKISVLTHNPHETPKKGGTQKVGNRLLTRRDNGDQRDCVQNIDMGREMVGSGKANKLLGGANPTQDD